ncbi:MAG: outer membrane beta-barrel protein [Cytophagales bacterium]|nr:outer membrane beta-barrel protein [Cytophagales bacterium]
MTKFLLSFLLLVVSFTALSQEKLSGQPDLPGDILFDIGFNSWDQSGDTLKNWPSRSLGIYYNKRFKLSNKFSFYGAAGFGIEKFSFEKNYHLTADNSNIVLDTLIASISMNKLSITYFDIPLELRFHPKGTIDGEGFFVSAGAIPGLKMGAHTKVKYEVDGHKQREKVGANFGLQDFRMGLQFRVGWKGINIFYKTYLTKVFRHKQDLVDPDLNLTGELFNPKVTSFGINFSGF